MTVASSDISLFALCALALLVVVALYMFFVAASLGLARGKIARLEEMEEQGFFCASRALALLRDADGFLLCAQFGRVLTSIASGFMLAVLSFVFSDRTPAGGLQIHWAIEISLYVLLAATILLVVQIVKAISMQYPERVLCAVALPLDFHSWLFRPFLLSVRRAINGVLARFNLRAPSERDVTISSEDLGEIVEKSAAAGSLEKEDRRLLRGVAELSERVAYDVMTPRKDVVWIRDSANIADVVRTFREESVSRLLVCGGDLDDVRGVLLGKDLLEFVGRTPEALSWRKLIRPVYRTPDTKVVRDLLADMRAKQIHFSVVTNEHGEVAGIVTLEDLLEELVGEIFDEFDNPQHELPTVVETKGEFIVAGETSRAEVESRCGISLPDGEYQTVSGFVQDRLGRLPAEGDSFSEHNITVTVLEVCDRRVVRLSLRKRSGESGIALKEELSVRPPQAASYK
jgi:putative hemolysin